MNHSIRIKRENQKKKNFAKRKKKKEKRKEQGKKRKRSYAHDFWCELQSQKKKFGRFTELDI